MKRMQVMKVSICLRQIEKLIDWPVRGLAFVFVSILVLMLPFMIFMSFMVNKLFLCG
jgi:hypothetical protein